jgi:hypothetical protein
VFLGNDLLAYILLAFGGALVVGNGLALVRPPPEQHHPPPLARTAVMIGIGGVATVWALASLLSK